MNPFAFYDILMILVFILILFGWMSTARLVRGQILSLQTMELTEAARALGVPSVECVAFEDSPNGVIAAKAARMRCVAVPDPALIDDRRFLAADLRLSSLTEFRPEMLDLLGQD